MKNETIKTTGRILSVVFVICVVLSAFATANEVKTYKIGVLAKRGTERCLAKWTATADYLTETIENASFEIAPLSYEQVYPNVEAGEVDFLVVNSSFYVNLEAKYGASRIATLKNLRQGKVCTVFGGVIITKAGSGIDKLTDLKGKRFMAVEETSFGGWQTAWRELKEQGIDPYKDFADLQFGGTHDAVVYAVGEGKVDAGTVRTDAMERMAAEGKIDINDYAILFGHEEHTQLIKHDDSYKSFPFAHSTRLYPEWPFVKAAHTLDEIAEKVAAALLSMSADSDAAKTAECAGWTIPHNYRSVNDCLKELRIAPYEDYGKLTVVELIKTYYWLWLLGAVGVILAIVAFAIRTRRINIKLSKSITERKQVEDTLRESEEKYRLLADNSMDAIWQMDLKLVFTYISPSIKDMMGYTVEEWVGNRLSQHASTKEYFNMARKALSAIKEYKKFKHLTFETVMLHKDGTEIPVEITAKLLINKKGLPIGFQGTTRDITERKQAEKELRETTDYLQSLFDCASAPIIVWDREFKITRFNHAFENMTQRSAAAVLGKPLSILFPEENLEKTMTHIDSTLSGERWEAVEIPIQRADGEIRIVLWNSAGIQSDKGDSIIATIAQGQDITERKQAEEALRESEEKVRTLYDSSSDSIMLLDEKGFFDCNEATLQLFGCASREEFCSRHPADFSPPTQPDGTDSMSYAKNNIAVALKEGSKRFEHLHRRTDGTDFPADVLLDVMVLGGKKVLQARVYDITERKQAEGKIKLLSSVVEQSTEGMAIVDLDGNLTFVNDAWCKMHGYKSPKELIGKSLAIFHNKEQLGNEVVSFNEQAKKLGTYSGEIGHITKDGKPFPTLMVTTLMKDEQGKPIALAGIVRDITKRKQAEKALIDSEKRFRNIAESMSDWIWEMDAKGVYTYVSTNVESVLGYRADEVIGKTPFDFMTASEAERVSQVFQQIVGSKEAIKELENWNLTKDGRSICFLTNGVPLLDNQGHLLGYRGVDKDITELKRLQALESRAERLETAGTIAGQVAHDFNNLLAPMIGYPEFIREQLPEDHPTLKYLEQIEKAAHKIAEINQDLLAMGRRGHYNLDVLNLNTIVQHALSELEPYPETLACVEHLADDLMDILGGGAQLHRMISNLLHNAKDAMQEIGQLSVRTQNYYVDEVSITYGRVPKGEYVKLTISDTGCGIPEDIVQKIFDPFFTSKTTDKRRGSGLGMSVVDAVIKDHKGYIDLSTKVGEGTSFYIYFPITRETANGVDANPVAGGNERVLVVDDDDIQREVSLQLLKKLGYQVSFVESGEKAIEFIKESPQDLLILDMIMPGGIDGVETYRRILEISPHQKGIILSGFSESEKVLEAQRLGAGGFVRKPITKSTIAGAVRTELDRQVEVVTT